MTLPYDPLSPPPRDKVQLRRMLKAERMNLVDRLQRSEQLQAVLRVWLTQREDVTVRSAVHSVPIMPPGYDNNRIASRFHTDKLNGIDSRATFGPGGAS